MAWECFWIEPVGKSTEYVVNCPNGHRIIVESLPGVDFDDAPREPGEPWPDACPTCLRNLDYDREPGERAYRGKVGLTVWRRPDTGEEHTAIHEFGIGAMFDADWLPWKGQDGRSLSVLLPPGGMSDVWHMDQESNTGGHWVRSGDPPKVTASPSILTARYHGWLRDGILSDSLPDRPLDADSA